ncbi:MAG: rRNA maturation RNase YbeY [Candidatus Pacebacteria bacterium]|nr:rRNA maturation RNase YbeY [Candidatus Paceibacterota bacterium]
MATFDTKNLSITSYGTLPRVPFLDIKEKVLGKSYDLSISFVTEAAARSLNIKHRNKKYIPNTLSFSLTKKSGEIVMCIPAIKKEYKNFDMTYKKYLIFLILHSMLHLKGYEHGSTMEDKEQHYLAFFS